MFKKLLIIFLSLGWIVWISFADDTTDQIKNASTGDIITLDDGENEIWNVSLGSYSRNINKTNRNQAINWTNLSNSNIECKNWQIINIWTNMNNPDWKNTSYLNKNTESPLNKLVAIKGTSEMSITLKCDYIWKKPTKKFSRTNLNYQNIQEKTQQIWWLWNEPFPATKYKSKIEKEDTDKFKSKQNIDNQPSFIDIVYLQLQVIWDIAESIETTNESFDFENLFDTNDDFNNYNSWLDKFDNYNTKQEFIDAASWAVTLKDLWVANYVVNWLYDCANNNNCNDSIDFWWINPVNKYENYTLKDIDSLLYKNTKNTIKEAITYYNNLSSSCNDLSNITDTFLKAQTEKLCKKILSNNLDETNELEFENYNLGYGLWQRIENLETIKNNIPKDGINLLGIYNIYYELTNLNLWTNKLSNIKKATKEKDTDKQYESIRKIFQKEKQSIQVDRKINDYKWKKWKKKATFAKVLTPWDIIHERLKDNENLDIDKDVDIVQTSDWNNLTILNWTEVLGQNIADIYYLGNIWSWITNWSIEESLQTRQIDLWEDYANATIEVSFDLQIKWGWEEWTSNCRWWTADYFKVNSNDNEIYDTTHCSSYNVQWYSYWPEEIELNNIELNNNWIVNLDFIVWSTANTEIANITNIEYEIVEDDENDSDEIEDDE